MYICCLPTGDLIDLIIPPSGFVLSSDMLVLICTM